MKTQQILYSIEVTAFVCCAWIEALYFGNLSKERIEHVKRILFIKVYSKGNTCHVLCGKVVNKLSGAKG